MVDLFIAMLVHQRVWFPLENQWLFHEAQWAQPGSWAQHMWWWATSLRRVSLSPSTSLVGASPGCSLVFVDFTGMKEFISAKNPKWWGLKYELKCHETKMLNLWSAPPSGATGTFWTPPWQDKAHVRQNTSPISCAIHEIRVCSAMHCLTFVSLVGKVVVKHHCSLLDTARLGNARQHDSGIFWSYWRKKLPWGHGSSCWAALSSSLHIWRIPRRRPWFSTWEVAVEVLTCRCFFN